ncbi:hypothetical protein [Candidatus Clostridium helianthi]|uniref:Uncharacterized protein n=1 Tax=Candidatus Clostridium helianthi TaxID=3381660 RepID=A0ABW8S5A2_9CLOT
MALDELDDIQREVKAGYMKTLNNIQNYFGSEIKYFEIKKDSIKLAAEIFEESLRMIEEEKMKILGGGI